MADEQSWPPLPLHEWQPTYANLHLWTQVVGKIRVALTPLVNHWWNSTLYLTARGLTTSPIPWHDGAFQISFDFIEHRLVIETSWGAQRVIALVPQTCGAFYRLVMGALQALGIDVHIRPVAAELPEPVRLDADDGPASYDGPWVERWWRIMLNVHSVLEEFRARFIGKSSPVHFFWGSFDLAVSRFSGRRAPPREGAGKMINEAYSHETFSAGFWPGSGPIAGPAFFAYIAPQPPGFERAAIKPSQARYDTTLGEYILMYDDMRAAPSPREALLEFAQSTYEAGANLAGWNREELERK